MCPYSAFATRAFFWQAPLAQRAMPTPAPVGAHCATTRSSSRDALAVVWIEWRGMVGWSLGALRQAPQRPPRPLPPSRRQRAARCCPSEISAAGQRTSPPPFVRARPLAAAGAVDTGARRVPAGESARGKRTPASGCWSDRSWPPSLSVDSRRLGAACRHPGRRAPPPRARPCSRAGQLGRLTMGARRSIDQVRASTSLAMVGRHPGGGPGGEMAPLWLCDEGVAQGSVPLVCLRGCRKGRGAGAPPNSHCVPSVALLTLVP